MIHDPLKRTMLLFLGLSLVVLVGYASAQNSPDVTGTWVGGPQRGATTITLVLKQTGNSVTGTAVGVGTDDGRVSGTVDGNTIRLRFNEDTATCVASEAARNRSRVLIVAPAADEAAGAFEPPLRSESSRTGGAVARRLPSHAADPRLATDRQRARSPRDAAAPDRIRRALPKTATVTPTAGAPATP